MLNVVFASDENYVSFLKISLNSLLEHNINEFKKINIFILDDGISDKSKKSIEKLALEYSESITFIKTKQLEKMNITILGLERNLNKTSFTTYSRLFISTLLPTDIDKVLYLDCDSLIVNSIKELWNLDISNYYCGAVFDGINTSVKERLGFEKDENYFNAGVLLINLKKWRENNVEEKFIEFMINNQNKFYQHDQGIINNIFKDHIEIISPKYNLQNYFQILDYNLARKYICMETEYYTKEIIDESQKNPVFLHFCGLNYDRPWYNKNHPKAGLFREYAKKVDCEYVIQYLDEIPLKAKIFYMGVNNSFIKLLLKVIPNWLVRKLINRNAIRGIEIESEKAKIEN